MASLMTQWKKAYRTQYHHTFTPLPFERNLTSYLGSGFGQEPYEGAHSHAFPGTRFPKQGQDFPSFQRERYPIHGLYHAITGVECDG
jgi:hypothetical protein